MKQRRIIAAANMPVRFPLVSSLVCWLFLDRINASQWIYGVMGVLFFLIWIIWLIDTANADQVVVLKSE